jgi:hypothetical protein
LPAGTLVCSIRHAYQSADASHPKEQFQGNRDVAEGWQGGFFLVEKPLEFIGLLLVNPEIAVSGRARSPPSKEVSPHRLFIYQAPAAETPIGRALPEESTCRTESIQRLGRNSCGAPVRETAKQQ